MKGVIYARYSCDNQREESIEGQLQDCKEYAKRHDILVVDIYIDRAFSAKTDRRPAFQQMIKDSAKRGFEAIIVWKLDRFARNRYDSATYKAKLRKNGVRVISANENISEGSEGILLESVLEGMAEYYSAELSEKVIRGHTENALKCRYNGGTPTFGYIIDKDMQYQIDPRTAPAVLEMFTMYDKGATMKEIVARMSERGVTTVRGKKIDLNFVARLLKNRKYIGEYSYRHIVTPNGIPAIVPQDLFDRVQQRLAVNRKAPARHKAEDDYLLTTKLFCGTCGAMMVGESGTSSSKGRKYHYYRCVNTKKHHACDAKHKTVRKLPLENAVVNAVMAKIMDDNFVEYVADAVMDIQSRESSVLPALRKQLEEAESGITNMLNAIQMGIINASTKQRLDELEERKKDIELQIIQEEMKHPAVSREDVVYFVCRFRSLDTSKLDARRRLIDSFVNAVTIFDDYILITFNYKEGETRIDFADIESSDLQSVGGSFSSILLCQLSGLVVPDAKNCHGHNRDQNERAADRTSEENAEAAFRNDHGTAEVLFSQRSKHDAQQNRHQLEAHAPQEVRNDTENQNDINIIDAVVGRIRACNAECQYDGSQNLIGNAGNMRIKPGQTSAHDIHEHIHHEQAQHDGIKNVALLGKQGRTGNHAVKHECAHQNGRCTVTGDTQRQHGDHSCTASAVVGRFRNSHALDLTLAERFRVLGRLLDLIVSNKRRQTAASAGRCANDDTDKRTNANGLAAAPIFLFCDLILRQGLGVINFMIRFGIIFLLRQIAASI